MSWQPIATIPKEGLRALVHSPEARWSRHGHAGSVFEAIAYPDGDYHDPVYYEWDGEGATHWMPLPEPPK